MKTFSLTLLIVLCVCEASPAQRQGRDQGASSNSGGSTASAAQSGNSASASAGSTTAGSTSGGNQSVNNQQSNSASNGSGMASGDSQSQSRRRRYELKPLRTQRGSFPGFMQRSGNRRNMATGQNAAFLGQTNFGQQVINNQNGRGRNRTQADNFNQQNLQQVFLNNAMLFDSNSDSQLAAHELGNLFLVLISQNNQQINNNNSFGVPWFGNGNRIVGGTYFDQANQNQRGHVGSTAPQAGGTGTMAVGGGGDINFILANGIPSLEGVRLQDAMLLFLYLTLQFDQDGDGALDQNELRTFAAQLLNNDLDVLNAAGQVR